MASRDAKRYRAIGVPSSSALPRFTSSSPTFRARTVRRAGCKTILSLAEIAFCTCLIHRRCPCEMGARDVPRHLVTTSTCTLRLQPSSLETRTPCWSLQKVCPWSRQRLRILQLDRCTPQHRSNSRARMTLACSFFASRDRDQERYTNSSFDPAISITSPGDRSTPAPVAGCPLTSGARFPSIDLRWNASPDWLMSAT